MAELLSVTVTWRGGYATDVVARSHTVRVDEPGSAGGGDTGMMPTELFCASIASCFCLAVAHVAGKRSIETPGLAVTVEAERAGRELRYERFTITTRAEIDPQTLSWLVERAKPFCWVSNTLAAGTQLDYRT
ncbi:MAG: OsmC family protein [Solirubrobacteraceae bacterium]